MLTVNMYSGNPIKIQKKPIRVYLTTVENQGLSIFKRSLIFFFIVAVKEGEVLICRFRSVKNIEVLGCNYKGIKFIVRQCSVLWRLSDEFVEVTHRSQTVWKFSDVGYHVVFIKHNIGNGQLFIF